MLYKVTYFGNAVNYGSEQFFMCPMFVTECFHNKCLNCQPCVQFIFSPGCESDMILSVMTLQYLKNEIKQRSENLQSHFKETAAGSHATISNICHELTSWEVRLRSRSELMSL